MLYVFLGLDFFIIFDFIRNINLFGLKNYGKDVFSCFNYSSVIETTNTSFLL